MISKLSRGCVRVMERWMPDPLVIAIFLTVITVVAAMSFTEFTFNQAVDAWGNSYWKLLAFTTQMILILALGHVLANTRAVFGLLNKIARQVRSAPVAYMGLTIFAGLASLFSWGLGLVVPAVLSRIIADNCRQRGIKVHFPLLVACGYCGGTVGMQGITSTIPLTLNTPGHFMEDQMGLVGLDQTIFSLWSISIVVTILLVLPWVLYRAAPPDDEVRELHIESADDHPSPLPQPHSNTPSERLENSRWVTLLLAAIGGVYVVRFFATGGQLQLNSLNMIFVVLGLAFADSPRHYLELLGNAAKVAGPFLIQYPLYAGLMGLIAESGLGALIVGGFVQVATADTLSLWTFFSAAFLNLFIPSAGGQWAVQGPIVIEAATQLGADLPRVAMAVTVGEVWTNCVQPLFAVPVLAIAGLHIRDIMGFCLIALATLAPIYLVALVFF